MNFIIQPRRQGKSQVAMLLMHYSLKFKTITGIPTKDIHVWDTKQNEMVVWKADGEVYTEKKIERPKIYSDKFENLEDNWVYKMYIDDTNKMLK